jgi:hypothetical protein
MDCPTVDPISGHDSQHIQTKLIIPLEVEQLRASAVADDVNAIQTNFEIWRAQSANERLSLDRFTAVLSDAVNNNSAQTVACLLDYGLPTSSGLFQVATQAKSYDILQAFLDHGWSINAPINFLTPPALA